MGYYTTRYASETLPLIYGNGGWSWIIADAVALYWARRPRLRFVRDWAMHHDGGE